jgi:hypothetical protein
VRIVAFAFFLDGSIAKAADRGAQTFNRLVPNSKRSRHSVHQGFALGIKGLLGRCRITTFPASGSRRHPAKMSGKIFISYRRDESAAWAGRLSDRLKNHFPSNQIFMDQEKEQLDARRREQERLDHESQSQPLSPVSPIVPSTPPGFFWGLWDKGFNWDRLQRFIAGYQPTTKPVPARNET